MRRFLSRPCRAPPSVPRPAPFRPRLEELEGRLVPNASRVFDTAGNPTLFVVRSDGSLTRYDGSGATVYFADGDSGPRVRRSERFRLSCGERAGAF